MGRTYYYDASDSNRHADVSSYHADPECHHLSGADQIRASTTTDDSDNYCGTCTDIPDKEAQTETESEESETETEPES